MINFVKITMHFNITLQYILATNQCNENKKKLSEDKLNTVLIESTKL